jgi:hypothetical protein
VHERRIRAVSRSDEHGVTEDRAVPTLPAASFESTYGTGPRSARSWRQMTSPMACRLQLPPAVISSVSLGAGAHVDGR